MDADHMDIYGNRDSIIAAFEDFACRVVPKGGLFIKRDWKSGSAGLTVFTA